VAPEIIENIQLLHKKELLNSVFIANNGKKKSKEITNPF